MTTRQAKPQNNGSPRIFVLGLDSADPDLVQRWSVEGHLPFLTSLMKSGVWTRLISSASIFPDSPWPSFNTGVHPGKHGFYNYLQLRRGTSEIIRASARSCRYLPFWWLLRGSGKKVAIFDVPKTYPLEGIDGIQVAAWGEEYPLLRQSSLPRSLAKELSARFGRYRPSVESARPRRVSRQLRVYDMLRANIQKKLDATQFLLTQEDWDLFITVFAETHIGGHHFYHHFDPRHWAHAQQPVRLSHTLPNLYAELDSALADLLAGIPDDATILIVSVHGIETNYSGNHLMPAVLEKLGFQKSGLKETAANGSAPPWQASASLRRLVPAPVRDLINDYLLPDSFHDRMRSRQFSHSIQWKTTKAFFIPSDQFQGFMSVNLGGREPCGVVRPGQEYEEVCGQLCYELKRLSNPDTGKPAVRDVIQISKVFNGKNQYSLPDVVVCWSKDGPIHRLHHPAFGVISEQNTKLRKAQHSREGFMIAAGAHINTDATITGASTMDLAPTILYLLGQSIPDDMDGKVLLDLIDDDFKKDHEVKYESRPLVTPEDLRAGLQ